eukprot:2696976-Rhodomonas_salina.2
MHRLSLQAIYDNHDYKVVELDGGARQSAPTSALDTHMRKYDVFDGMNGFARMQNCRRALEALDRRGWDRSYHQKRRRRSLQPGTPKNSRGERVGFPAAGNPDFDTPPIRQNDLSLYVCGCHGLLPTLNSPSTRRASESARSCCGTLSSFWKSYTPSSVLQKAKCCG